MAVGNEMNDNVSCKCAGLVPGLGLGLRLPLSGSAGRYLSISFCCSAGFCRSTMLAKHATPDYYRDDTARFIPTTILSMTASLSIGISPLHHDDSHQSSRPVCSLEARAFAATRDMNGRHGGVGKRSTETSKAAGTLTLGSSRLLRGVHPVGTVALPTNGWGETAKRRVKKLSHSQSLPAPTVNATR